MPTNKLIIDHYIVLNKLTKPITIFVENTKQKLHNTTPFCKLLKIQE